MEFLPVSELDFEYLHEFEPPNWGDLVPRFSYFIDSSFCFPLKLVAGQKTVAIGTTILHEDSAWLASIIVHPDERNKGYGGIITSRLIDTIDQQRYTTIYLDATDLGYPVYRKLGFEVEAKYAHLKALQPITGLQFSSNIAVYDPMYLDDLLELDQLVSCEDRRNTLLEHTDNAMLYLDKNKLAGFYLPSLGNGLVIAANDTAGIALATYRLENNYYSILPEANKGTIAFLEQHSLVHFRSSRRMYIGEQRNWRAVNIYNRISGQLG